MIGDDGFLDEAVQRSGEKHRRVGSTLQSFGGFPDRRDILDRGVDEVDDPRNGYRLGIRELLLGFVEQMELCVSHDVGVVRGDGAVDVEPVLIELCLAHRLLLLQHVRDNEHGVGRAVGRSFGWPPSLLMGELSLDRVTVPGMACFDGCGSPRPRGERQGGNDAGVRCEKTGDDRLLGCVAIPCCDCVGDRPVEV